MTRVSPLALFAVLATQFVPATVLAFATGHHGGLITHCTAPTFFDESPGKDAKVGSLEHFTVTASDNTDPATVKGWVNNVPVTIKIEKQRSGRLTIEGIPPTAIDSGRAWIKLTAMSNDGCDQLHTWNVYAGH